MFALVHGFVMLVGADVLQPAVTVEFSPKHCLQSSKNIWKERCNSGKTCLQPKVQRHLISDAFEWINEIPIVAIHNRAKPQPNELAWTLTSGGVLGMTPPLPFAAKPRAVTGYTEPK